MVGNYNNREVRPFFDGLPVLHRRKLQDPPQFKEGPYYSAIDGHLYLHPGSRAILSAKWPVFTSGSDFEPMHTVVTVTSPWKGARALGGYFYLNQGAPIAAALYTLEPDLSDANAPYLGQFLELVNSSRIAQLGRGAAILNYTTSLLKEGKPFSQAQGDYITPVMTINLGKHNKTYV